MNKPLPHSVAPGNGRVLRQSAIAFGVGGIMQDVDYMCSANRLRIVDPGVLHAEIFLQLPGAFVGDELHVILAAELQTSGGTSLDACRFQPLADSVRA